MNTREENVSAVMREDQDIQVQHELRGADLKWAEQWRNGNGQCPRCGGSEFDLVDVNSEGRMRYETLRCKSYACGAHWKVEFRETALSVLRDDGEADGEWIELRAPDTAMELEMADICWEDISLDAALPGSRLLAAVKIGGVNHHLEAIEVRDGEIKFSQSATCALCDEILMRYDAIDPDGSPFSTVEIRDRTYALFLTPFRY